MKIGTALEEKSANRFTGKADSYLTSYTASYPSE
jgi:hypothetical protein